MSKRIILILLMLIIITLSSSCNYIAKLGGYDIDKYCAVSPQYDEETDTYYLEYQNNKYFNCNEFSMFNIAYNKENFVEIGWYYNFPFTFAMTYYSYTTDSPDYFFPAKRDTIWVKETFDLENEIFIIEGTEIEIELSKIFTSNTLNVYQQEYEYQKLCLRSQKYNALSINIDIIIKEEICYAFIFNMDPINAYQISDDFYGLLIKNNVILDK